MKDFKIGLQLYSVKNALNADFEGTLRKVKGIGYDYVEFAGNYGEKSAEELKKLLDDIGLECISVHQGIDLFKEQGEKFVKFITDIGAEYSVIPWWPAELGYGTENWKDTEEKFRWLSGLVKAGGLKFLYHNHDFEFANTFDGKVGYDCMMDALKGVMDPELDTCWIHYAGYDPAEYIRKYKGRAEIIHLKDFFCKKLGGGPVYALIDSKGGEATKASTKEDNGFEYRPLGMGMQDFDSIIAACEDVDAKYLVVEQDDTVGRTELEAVEISRKFLKDKYGL